MMFNNTYRVLITVWALTLTFVGSSQVALWDQTSGATLSGLVSQDFENLFNGNDCRIADDFTVPNGETWYIDSVKIYGFYNVSSPDSAGMNFTIYNNNNGAIGSSVFNAVFQENLDVNEDGTITATWQLPLQVSAGTYWMAASARKNYLNDQGVWYWYLDSSNTGLEAKWENPGGSWNAGCTSWTDITDNSCVDVDYSGVVFQIYGCLGSVKPTINPLPEDTTFCQGDQTTITATSNTSGVNFAWNTGDSTATITATQNGVYVVTAYDPVTLCGATAKMNINVIPSPVSNLMDDTICEGQSRSYLTTCNSCSVLWSDGSTGTVFTKSTTGIILVTMTDSLTGCVGVDTGWLEVLELPDIEFYPGSPAHGCHGDTMEIGVTGAYETYFWDHPGWSSLKDTTALLVDGTGTYYITVANSLGCLINDTLEVIFHDLPYPDITISYTSSFKTRITADSIYQSYEWSNGKDDVEFTTWKSGVYTLTVTDEYGCVGERSIYVITIPQGIEEANAHTVSIFPNPANDLINVELKELPSTATTIDIIDVNGRLAYSQAMNKRAEQIDVSSFVSGTYTVFIRSDKPVAVSTLVIE